MRVCTDSYLFGAWVAHIIMENQKIQSATVLDIGTGTGLLSLMLAQKLNAQIDAIEIDTASCNEARNNFINSPWNEHLQAFHADIKEWQPNHAYDLIICNPPFYNNDLLPADHAKNVSKHSLMLSLEDLLIILRTLLKEDGHFAILLPEKRTEWLIRNIEKYSLYISHLTKVKQTNKHNYFRSMFIIQKKEGEVIKDRLSIRDNDNAYTKKFTDLLKDYYLYM